LVKRGLIGSASALLVRRQSSVQIREVADVNPHPEGAEPVEAYL